jgi:hypothetical protein
VARKGPDVCTTWCVRVGTAKRGKEGTGCLHHLVRACGDRLAVPAVMTVVAAQGASGSGVGASFSTGASLQMRVCRVVRARARHACDACVHGRCPIPPAVIVARGCLYYGTGIANSPCSWCAGHMSPPRLPPGGRRHLLPGHLPHRRTVAGAGVRVVRARARHVCDSCASPAAYAPSRARRLCRAHARSSVEGAARPPLCADEAGELVSWSGRGHRGCSRRCLSRAGVCTPVLGSLTRPAAGARCWWRFQVLGRIGGAGIQHVDAPIGSSPAELA